jgi:hypothetical protein
MNEALFCRRDPVPLGVVLSFPLLANTPFKLLVPVLLLLILPAGVQAQFAFTTNNGTITITKYTGSGGTIVIPNSTNGLPVTCIAAGAFGTAAGGGITSPFSVTIPYTITNIASGEFGYSPGLTAISVDPDNLVYSSLEGVLFDKSKTTLLQFPQAVGGSYTVPSEVTNIATLALYFCRGLTNLIIPGSVLSIGTNAVAVCTSLASVALGPGIADMARGAFHYCSSLTSVTIPNSVTNIGAGAFVDCTSLTNVTLGNGITIIGSSVFQYCSSLTSVTIPNSVTNIGDRAFFECTHLTNITIPNRVTSLGYYVFWGCNNLGSIWFQGSAPGVNSTTFGNGVIATVYYLPGTTNWGLTLGGLSTVLWNPLVQSPSAQTNQLGFTITGTTGIPIVVEASTDLAGGNWTALETCTLTNGSIYFSDSQWTNYPARFYRIRSP